MDKYLIGGIDALKIVDLFGSPLFVYNEKRIIRQYEKLCAAFSGLDFRIHYACKANESVAILDTLKKLGSGLDTVSPNEIKRALKAGFTAEDIVFTPSCPSIEEIEFALDLNIKIHLGGLEYLEMLGDKLNGKRIGLRLNPALAIEGNQKISTAHANSKFGVPLDQLPKLRSLLKKYQIELSALHIHTGSDIKSWHDLAKSFDVLLDVAREFTSVDTIDIGSGFKVKYSNNDNQVDLMAYTSYIKESIRKFNRPIKIIAEPGKYLVSEAGSLIARVNVVKQGYSKLFVGVNSGFHHLIRPMYYDVYHHIINISNMNGSNQLYDVVGQLCEEDTFAFDIPLAEVHPGDYLVFENVGAYAYAMAMTYNLREKPVELYISGGEITKISKERISI